MRILRAMRSNSSLCRAATGDPRHAAHETLDALLAALRQLRCLGSQRLVKLGVSMTHIHVLAMLRQHGPMPMSRLAELLDVSLSSATGIVDRLAERGYVERAGDPADRRVVLVRPTASAGQILDDADALRVDLLRAAVDRLGDDQLQRLATSFEDLRVALEAELAARPDGHRHGDADDSAATPTHLHHAAS